MQTELIEINANQLSAKSFRLDIEDIESIKKTVTTFSLMTIDGIDDKAGLKAVRDARLSLRKIRVAIDKRRAELKADSLAYGRRVDEIAKELTALVEPTEKLLDSRETEVENEIKAIAAAKLKDRMDRLAEYRSVIPATTIEAMDDATFAECLEWARKNYEDARAAEKLLAEAEANRVAEAEVVKAAEEQRLKAEREKLEAEQAAFRAEQAKAEKLREEQENAMAVEFRRLEEQRRQQELEAAKIQAVEQARREEAERQEQRLRKEKEQQEAERLENELREKRKPDREKFLAIADHIESFVVIPPGMSDASKEAWGEIEEAVMKAVGTIRGIVQKM